MSSEYVDIFVSYDMWHRTRLAAATAGGDVGNIPRRKADDHGPQAK